ncbi:MAG: PQQ-binding-like beta-propeller repeat protein [Deltaproteobacteria bacterium]|jgi:outer membrane protein assembly factor BamB|nr:PQQ-binding-like beta-propeller repeat protein [Deltaproteobacteria bacterium]
MISIKAVFLLILIFLQIQIISCSSSSVGISGSNSGSKELIVSPKFIRAASEQKIQKYRKINRARPMEYGKLLILANAHDGLTAFDLETGEKKWHFFVFNGVEKEPVLYKDNLYFGGNDGNFYSIKAQNGVENWKSQIKSEIVASPSFDSEEGRVYFLTTTNSLFALDAENGKQVWTYTRQDPSNYSIRGGTTPLIHHQLIYVGFSEGSFVAFNKSNGTINWEIQLNKNKRFKDIDSTAVLSEGKIFVSGYDDKLFCLASANGEILWRFEAGGYLPVTIKQDLLYYPSTNGKVYALNKNTAKKVWEIEVLDGIPSEISLIGQMLVFGESQGSIVFFNASDGKKIKSFEPGRGILSSILVNEKKSEVYFISGEANLYALEVKWKYKNLFSFVD